MSQFVKPGEPEWEKWLKLCEYTGWNPSGPLRPMRYHGLIIPFNAGLGVKPTFFNVLMNRMKKVQPNRIAIVGEPGISKTYTAIMLALLLDPKFWIDQIVLYGKDYLELQRTLPPRRCIVLEEPTFHLAARTWYDQWQRIIVQTIESTRFQNNPLFIPVVNRNLIDKTIREYYINYVIVMFRRGVGRVYATKHSQWKDYITKKTVCDLYLPTPGFLLYQCGRETCLECVALPVCNKNIFPLYERKRAEAIKYYQAEGAKELKRLEEKKHKTSFAEIVQTAAKERMNFLSLDGKDYLVADLMAKFDCGHNKALDIRSYLLKHYPLEAKEP